MKHEFWLATNNKNKLKEINLILKKIISNYTLKCLSDLDKKIDIAETGLTLEENSLIKAKHLYKLINKPVLADDSGLEIKELNNFPGVYSKRWSFPIIEYNAQNELLLKKCINLKNRSAIMKTVITYYDPKNNICKQFTGIMNGEIAIKQKLGNGFGYDAIFYLPKLNKMVSELTNLQKNMLSHRYQAIKKLCDWLKENNNEN